MEAFTSGMKIPLPFIPWWKIITYVIEPEVGLIAKLTQRQAVAHQVRGPDVVHGLGSRTEDERPVAGSDICCRAKKKLAYLASVTYSVVAAFWTTILQGDPKVVVLRSHTVV